MCKYMRANRTLWNHWAASTIRTTCGRRAAGALSASGCSSAISCRLLSGRCWRWRPPSPKSRSAPFRCWSISSTGQAWASCCSTPWKGRIAPLSPPSLPSLPPPSHCGGYWLITPGRGHGTRALSPDLSPKSDARPFMAGRPMTCCGPSSPTTSFMGGWAPPDECPGMANSIRIGRVMAKPERGPLRGNERLRPRRRPAVRRSTAQPLLSRRATPVVKRRMLTPWRRPVAPQRSHLSGPAEQWPRSTVSTVRAMLLSADRRRMYHTTRIAGIANGASVRPEAGMRLAHCIRRGRGAGDCGR